MAIAVDAVSTGFLSAAATSLTVSHPVGTGTNRYLVAYFENSNGNANHCTGATYGGVAMSVLKTTFVSGAAVNIDVFGLVAPASGTANVVFTLSGTGNMGTATVISFTGVDQTTPAGTPVSSGTPVFSTAPTVTVASPPPDSLVLDCSGASWAAGRTRTVGANQTLRSSLDNTAANCGFSSTQLGSDGGVMSWTLSSASNWQMVAFALNAAAGGGATVTPGTGVGTWTGFAPTVSVGNATTVRPGLGAAVWAGFAPTILAGAGSGQLLPGRTVAWTSSNAAVAAAPPDGVTDAAGQVNPPPLTLLAAGTTNLQAHCEGVDSNIVPVTVTAPVAVATVEVTPTSLAGTVGGHDTLTAVVKDGSGNVLTGRSVTWSTSDAAIAGWTGGTGQTQEVDYLSAGSANIRAWCEGIGSNTVAVTVSAPAVAVASVTVSPTTLSGNVGGTGGLTAVVKDASNNILTGRTVNWRVSSTAILSVTSPGQTSTVGYLAAGSATVTANCEGIDSNGVPVTVSAPAGGLYANLPGNYTMPANAVTLMNPPATGNFWVWQNTVTQVGAGSFLPGGSIARPTGCPSGDPIGSIQFPAGFTLAGNAPGILGTHDISANNWTELYVCLIHQMSSNWVNHPTGINKVMFVNSSGGNVGQLVFLNYFNSQWSCARQNTNGGDNQFPVGSVKLGFWLRHEFQLIQNTNGAANGVCRFWETVYDRSGTITSGPTLTGQWTNVPWNATNKVWANLSWNPVYGGTSPGTLAATQYQWMGRIAYAGR